MSSESHVQAQIRLQAAKDGVMLWRNNSGALLDENGRMVRFGLGNDSKAVNKQYKSSDLIGITPVTITPDMVGKTLGVFTSIEVKATGVKYDERWEAQNNWIGAVAAWGGIGGFAQSVEDAQALWGWHR